MVAEKELIGKIRELRQIKPRNEWVSLVKSQILGEEPKLELFPFFKPIYAGLFAIFVLFGIFELSQAALPGDPLYSLKRVSERIEAVFVSEEEKPEFSLNLANKRLEELARITETNRVKNLPSAINEAQASISEAAKNLTKIETSTSSNPVAMQRVSDMAKKVGEKAEEIESRGVVIGGLEEFQGASDKLVLELLISDLKTRTLTEEQKEILNQMEELVEEGNYSEALILFHTEFNKPTLPEPIEEKIEEELIEEELEPVEEESFPQE